MFQQIRINSPSSELSSSKLSCSVCKKQLSQLMSLWFFSSSVNSFFKRSCAAIHWGLTSDFWSDPSSTPILHVCEQRRLWRDCADAQARLSLCCRLCDKYNNLMSWLNSVMRLDFFFCIIFNTVLLCLQQTIQS